MTTPIDITFARAYLKADGDDDEIITAQLLSAWTMCEDYCNRKIYVDAATQATDFAQALLDRAAAVAARKTQLEAITTFDRESQETKLRIRDYYLSQLALIDRRMHGIVLDDAINAAMLMTLGHLYINREDNLATGNNVVQVPVGAQRILQPKLWIGDLAEGVDPEHHHHWFNPNAEVPGS